VKHKGTLPPPTQDSYFLEVYNPSTTRLQKMLLDPILSTAALNEAANSWELAISSNHTFLPWFASAECTLKNAICKCLYHNDLVRRSARAVDQMKSCDLNLGWSKYTLEDRIRAYRRWFKKPWQTRRQTTTLTHADPEVTHWKLFSSRRHLHLHYTNNIIT